MTKQKWLKIAKMSLITLLCVSVLIIPISAIYSSTTERKNYIPPIRFQADVDTSTFELTPIVKAFEDTANTETSEIGVTQSTIRRTNWSITDPSTSTVYKAWRDVAYRLAMDTHHSTDNFTMTLTADTGYYNFTSYDVPYIVVPYGYTATIEASYRVIYANTDEHHEAVYQDGGFTETYYQDDIVPLLRPYYVSHGVQYDYIGNVIITKYNAEITFTKVGDSQGNSGYYTFNEVLSYVPDDLLEAMATDGDIWFWCEDNPITIIVTLSDGTTQELEIHAIYFDDPSQLNMGYEIPPDYSTLIYDFTADEWWTLFIGEEEITGIELRQLYFSKPFEQTFNPNDNAYDAFRTWFLENTIYSDSSQVLTDTAGNYAFTDGDGGMYVKYLAIDSELFSPDAYLKGMRDDSFRMGVAKGDNGFSGDFVSWAVNAVGGALAVEIFPNFSLGGLLGVIVAIGLTVVFLKMFAGG